VTLSKASADTEFAPTYYNEVVMQAIDALNILYVAVTRAERELHIMLPAKPAGIGKTIMAAVGALQSSHEIKADEYTYNVLEDGTLAIDYGAPTEAPQHTNSHSATLHLNEYPTAPVTAKIKLKIPTARYGEGGNRLSLSPRDMGVLMHRVFQNARSQEDVMAGIRRLENDAVVSHKESVRLSESIERAFADPRVADWFSDKWKLVRNESDILLPSSADVRRPDRVMIGEPRAVVVDYKFGRVKESEHKTQIKRYMELLGQMGDYSVEGYLWYVTLGEIEMV
jgi:ATP-dependent exoDNAse (exonuclease V) beta subunit